MIPESKYSNSRRRRTQLDSVCASKDQNLILGGLLGSGRCDSEVVHRRNLPSTPMSTSAVPRHSDHRSHLHCGAFRHVERHTLPIPRDEAICRPRVVEPRHLQIVEKNVPGQWEGIHRPGAFRHHYPSRTGQLMYRAIVLLCSGWTNGGGELASLLQGCGVRVSSVIRRRTR